MAKEPEIVEPQEAEKKMFNYSFINLGGIIGWIVLLGIIAIPFMTVAWLGDHVQSIFTGEYLLPDWAHWIDPWALMIGLGIAVIFILWKMLREGERLYWDIRNRYDDWRNNRS